MIMIHVCMQIWVPTNPRGAERLPPGIVKAESDLFLRRLSGTPSEVKYTTAIYVLNVDAE